MMLYIWFIFVQSCMKIFSTVSSYRVYTIHIGKNSKGHNSVKNVGGVTIHFLCTSSDNGLYLLVGSGLTVL